MIRIGLLMALFPVADEKSGKKQFIRNEQSDIVIMENETTPSRQLNKYPLNQWKANRPGTIQY